MIKWMDNDMTRRKQRFFFLKYFFIELKFLNNIVHYIVNSSSQQSDLGEWSISSRKVHRFQSDGRSLEPCKKLLRPPDN
jgi:hypothetical protein